MPAWLPLHHIRVVLPRGIEPLFKSYQDLVMTIILWEHDRLVSPVRFELTTFGI